MTQPAEWSRAEFDRVAGYPAAHQAVPVWAYHIIGRHPLHPTVDKVLNRFAPVDWLELMAQWPHVSMKDPTRLAYTPNGKYAVADRVLVTSPGKFMAKHWPHIPSNQLRDLTLLTTTPSKMYFVRTTPEMIIGVEYGPQSCMASSSPYCGHQFEHEHEGFARLADWVLSPSNPEPNWDLHPYASYRPEDGWHMALRKDDNIITSRALCLTFKGRNYFVRSYRIGDGEGYSPACETLNAWLMEQKYEFVNNWPDGARIDVGRELDRAPYLDGDAQRAEHTGGGVFLLDTDGEWLFEKTDGSCEDTGSNDDDRVECSCCEDHGYRDDMTLVGRQENDEVCPRCLINNYTAVQGIDYTYYVHNDDARAVIGQTAWIDNDFPPDGVYWSNDEGSYIHESRAVFVQGYCYLDTSVAIVQCKDDEWRLRDDCWQDDETGDWYPEDEPYVEQPDGLRYHADTVKALRVANQLEIL